MPDTVELGETAPHAKAPGGLSDLLGRDCDRSDASPQAGSRPERRNRSRFGQLGQFLSSKATLKGMPIVAVDQRNTSRTCARVRVDPQRQSKAQATSRVSIAATPPLLTLLVPGISGHLLAALVISAARALRLVGGESRRRQRCPTRRLGQTADFRRGDGLRGATAVHGCPHLAHGRREAIHDGLANKKVPDVELHHFR
jgi:hypothetical protein